jgi:hypothetical protein
MFGCGSPSQPTIFDGDYASVTDQAWCMESKEALSELQDLAVRKDYDEMSRLFRSKGVASLGTGNRVKVLDRTFGGAVKVRISNDRECWTVVNALKKSVAAEDSTARQPDQTSQASGARDGNPAYTGKEERDCAVIRNQLADKNPAGMSRKEFESWAAKEIKHCGEVGLLGSAAATASVATPSTTPKEYEFAIQAERTGPRTIHVTIKTDLPESAQVSIDVTRSYYQKGLPDEYSGEIVPQTKMPVHSGNVEVNVNADDSRWVADNHEKLEGFKGLKGVVGAIQRVSPNVEVSAMFHPNGQPSAVSAMVGPNGEFIRGKHSRNTGRYHILEGTVKVRVPFMPDSGAQQ